MTKEQQLWLLRRLKVDWDEEINYQMSNGECDTEYLENLYLCYIALLGKPNGKGFFGYIEAYANKEIAESMLKEINELKECKSNG